LGEIENVPAPDNAVDVIISNCVINLSPDKRRVFYEAYRVLRPGGRLIVSDVVLLKKIADFLKKPVAAYVGCVSGAMMKDEYIGAIREAGFRNISIMGESNFDADSIVKNPEVKATLKKEKIPLAKAKEFAGSVISIKLCGFK